MIKRERERGGGEKVKGRRSGRGRVGFLFPSFRDGRARGKRASGETSRVIRVIFRRRSLGQEPKRTETGLRFSDKCPPARAALAFFAFPISPGPFGPLD